MRRLACLAALIALPVTPTLSLAQDVDVDGIRALVAAGRCEDAGATIEELPRRARRLPDVRVLEANCLLNEAREVEEVYLKERYQRTLVGRGGGSLPAAVTRSFYVKRVRLDDAARERALSLFRKALKQAPERQDIVVGTIAAFANAEEEREAAALLRAHRGFLDARDARDLALVVSDKLALRDEEGARVLAEALVDRLPDFPVSWLARLRVALAEHEVDTALEAARRIKPYPEGGREALRETARRLVFERRWAELVPVALELSQTEGGALVLLALARDRLSFGSGAPVWRDLDRRAGPVRDPARPLSALIDHYLGIHEEGVEPSAALHLSASRFLAEKGALEASIAEVDASLQKDPDDAEAWLHLARLLRAQFEFELARDAAREALARSEGETPSRAASMLARLHFSLGDDASALRVLEQNEADEPFTRGLAHLALGEREEAKRWLEKAASGDGAEAAMARAELEGLEGPKAPQARPSARSRDRGRRP